MTTTETKTETEMEEAKNKKKQKSLFQLKHHSQLNDAAIEKLCAGESYISPDVSWVSIEVKEQIRLARRKGVMVVISQPNEMSIWHKAYPGSPSNLYTFKGSWVSNNRCDDQPAWLNQHTMFALGYACGKWDAAAEQAKSVP